MVAIFSQDRKNIINAETVENVFEENGSIYVQTIGGKVLKIGVYTNPANAFKVMNYISFGLASAKDNCKTIIMPSETAVSNSETTAKTIIEEFKKKQEKDDVVGVKLAPEIQEIIDKFKGGGGEK